MFSPKTHSLICIEPSTSRASQLRQGTALPQKLSFPVRKQLQSALVTFQNAPGRFSTIIAVKSLSKSGIIDVEHILPLFKGVFNVEDAKMKSDDTAVQSMNGIPGFCPVLEPTPNVKTMQIPPSWSSGVNQLLSACKSSEDAQVTLICGSKRMGKSTFSRYVVNRMLEKHERVVFLEADIGQPEFGIQGVVSLHVLDKPLLGPPFANSHLEAKRSLFIGSTSPRDDPDYYTASLVELLLVWRQEFGVYGDDDATSGFSPAPLIINTHGWIKGLGYDLLMDLIHTAAPNFIFAFQSTATQSRNLPPSFITSVIPPGHTSSEGKAPPKILYLTSLMDDLDADFTAQRYHPSDHRMLNLVSYLHMNHMDKRNEGSTWWDFKTRLVERVPWCLDWTVGLQGIWVFFEEVKYSQLLYALNGSVVALIGDITRDNAKDIKVSVKISLVPLIMHVVRS
jgi:polynucleotide 5'-hydroxyl-kinase GRC3/NOL9